MDSVEACFLLPSSGPTIWIDGAIFTPETSFTNIRIRYIAEGAANVIWAIDTDPVIHPAHRPYLEGKLLRLRKGSRSLKSKEKSQPHPPKYMSTDDVADFYEKLRSRDLVGDTCLLDQKTVNISRRVINECNKVLDKLEEQGSRPLKRRGWGIQRGEPKGFLVESMLPSPDTALVELKPKLLQQSPGAPPDARRCRTCATHASRRTPIAKLPICPLALLSNSQYIISTALATLPKSAIHPLPAELSIQELNILLTNFFIGADISTTTPWMNTNGRNMLQHLAILQKQFDPHGVSCVADGCHIVNGRIQPVPAIMPQLANLSTAMTMRDCTLFIRMVKDSQKGWTVDAKLADLDPKGERLQKWHDDEMALNHEGWYTGEELMEEGTIQHTTCMLWDL
jgi:inositol-pentakisphosphate 2-kinase